MVKFRPALRNTAQIASALGACAIALGAGCSSVKSFLAVDENRGRQMPISNPFDAYPVQEREKQNIVLRTKKGDRAVEVELPGSAGAMTDFMVPMSPSFREPTRGIASDGSGGFTDERYHDKAPTISDREITSSLPQGISRNSEGSADAETSRREIETGLGLMPTEDSAPAQDRSYLASLDHVKQLYRGGRHEAALLEIDELLRAYPTDSKLYEMRGTLLDRVGRSDLALKSWNQALRLNPGNQALRRYVDKKQQKRGIASP